MSAVSKRRAPQQVDKAGSRSLASVKRAPSRGYPPSSLPPPSTMDEAKLLAAELVRAAPELLAECPPPCPPPPSCALPSPSPLPSPLPCPLASPLPSPSAFPS